MKSENQNRSDLEYDLALRGEGARARISARGLNDANMRWLAIGTFVVLSGFGFNQWASGIIRIIQAITDNAG